MTTYKVYHILLRVPSGLECMLETLGRMYSLLSSLHTVPVSIVGKSCQCYQELLIFQLLLGFCKSLTYLLRTWYPINTEENMKMISTHLVTLYTLFKYASPWCLIISWNKCTLQFSTKSCFIFHVAAAESSMIIIQIPRKKMQLMC